MKRIFSMALVLIMALSLISAVMVTVSAEEATEGTAGTVVVYKQDFEADALPSTWKSNNSAQFAVSLGTDSTGNKYLKAGSWKASNLAQLGATWEYVDGVWRKAYKKDEDGNYTNEVASYRLSAEGIQGRVSDSTNTVKLLNGRSYNYTWSGIAQGNGEIKTVSFGSSGINALSGGRFLAYNTTGDGGIKGTISQLYGTGQGWTTPTAHTMKGVTKTDLGNGWYSAGYTGIAYSLVKSDSERDVSVDSVTINGFFYQCGTPVDMLAALMQSTKSYCGSGFTDSDKYKFTITEKDLYGDEAKVDKTGKVWTEEELCREWNFTEDCTPLYSEQRIAAFQEALDKADIQYGIDDVTITADAKLYNDTVTVTGAEAVTVKAVTNTYTGESQTINGAGTITNVNDYYGTTYTVTTDAAGISATYNGEAVEVTEGDEGFVITIAPEKVTKNGELAITTLSKVVVFYADAEDKDGWSASNAGKLSFAEENGNAVAVLSGWNAATLVSKYVSNGSTADYYPRVQYAHSDNSLIKDVKYTLSYKFKYMDGATALTTLTSNQPFLNHSTPGITASKEQWGHYNSGKQHGGNNVSGTAGSDNWRLASKDFTPTTFTDDATSAKLANIQAEMKSFNNKGGIFDNLAAAAVAANTTVTDNGDGTTTSTVDQTKAAEALEAELAKHDYKMYVDDVKLEATTVAVPVSVSVNGNAAVKVNGVSVADGSSVKVGKGYTTAIRIAVDEGYELASVKIGGVEQNVSTDSIVTIKNEFSDAAAVEITTKKTYVAPSVEITEHKADTQYKYTVKVDGVETEKTSPYTIIMYGKVTGEPGSYGFKLSKDGSDAVELPGSETPVGGVFAIRVVGNGIQPGSYIATPYWTENETESKGTEYPMTVTK